MKFHLRLAAVISVAWVILLALRPWSGAVELVALLSVGGAALLGVVHAALALLFWWGAGDPPHRIIAVYVGLVVFTLRSAVGIYLVLYAMEGDATMVVLIEMVLSIGVLAALINGLPPVLRPELRK